MRTEGKEMTSRKIYRNGKAFPTIISETLFEREPREKQQSQQDCRNDIMVGGTRNPETRDENYGKIGTEPHCQLARKIQPSYSDHSIAPFKNVGYIKKMKETSRTERSPKYIFQNGHARESRKSKYPRCWTMHLLKNKSLRVEIQPHQKAGRIYGMRICHSNQLQEGPHWQANDQIMQTV